MDISTLVLHSFIDYTIIAWSKQGIEITYS